MNTLDQMEVLKMVGGRLRQIRKSKGISQQQIADITGMEKANISRIESGKTNTTVFTLLKICDALEVDCCMAMEAIPAMGRAVA